MIATGEEVAVEVVVTEEAVLTTEIASLVGLLEVDVTVTEAVIAAAEAVEVAAEEVVAVVAVIAAESLATWLAIAIKEAVPAIRAEKRDIFPEIAINAIRSSFFKTRSDGMPSFLYRLSTGPNRSHRRVRRIEGNRDEPIHFLSLN